ncbi:MAG: hypothetical protein ACLU24_01445 [Candidatus Pseudoruminococcus sp.]
MLKLFQKLAVSKGRAFGRSPQRAKHLWAKPNILYSSSGGLRPPLNFLLLATLVKKGGLRPPLECKEC